MDTRTHKSGTFWLSKHALSKGIRKITGGINLCNNGSVNYWQIGKDGNKRYGNCKPNEIHETEEDAIKAVLEWRDKEIEKCRKRKDRLMCIDFERKEEGCRD